MFHPGNECLLINEVEAHCLHYRACFCQCNFCFILGTFYYFLTPSIFHCIKNPLKKSEGIALIEFIINYLNFILEIFEQ